MWQDVVLASAEQVGVTIWRLRKCDDDDRDSQHCFLKLKDGTASYEAVRVTTEADFQVGDGLQLAIESPVKGYIYVVHQELDRNSQPGRPKLIYPLCAGGNSIGPGRPLLIPAQVEGKGIKVLKMRNDQGKDLAGERLTVIVARRPIEGLCAQGDRHYLAANDVRRWEAQWSGRLELFDLAGGDKETMTRNEWAAMRADGEGSRDLTTEDLAPQKLYVVERKQRDGVLIKLDLPYGNRPVKPRRR